MAKLIIVLALLILPGKKNASKQFCNFPYSSSIKILRFSSSQRVPSHRPYLPLLISPPCGLHLVFHLFHPAILFLFLIIPIKERILSSNLSFLIIPIIPISIFPNLVIISSSIIRSSSLLRGCGLQSLQSQTLLTLLTS